MSRTCCRSSRARACSKAFAGRRASDLKAVSDVLVRLSELAGDFPEEIESIDINPLAVFAEGEGVKALDALVVLRQSPRAKCELVPIEQTVALSRRLTRCWEERWISDYPKSCRWSKTPSGVLSTRNLFRSKCTARRTIKLKPEIRERLEKITKEMGLWLIDVPQEYGGAELGSAFARGYLGRNGSNDRSAVAGTRVIRSRGQADSLQP